MILHQPVYKVVKLTSIMIKESRLLVDDKEAFFMVIACHVPGLALGRHEYKNFKSLIKSGGGTGPMKPGNLL